MNLNNKSTKLKNKFHYDDFEIKKSVTSWFISPKSLLIFRGIACLYLWAALIGSFIGSIIDYDVENYFSYFTNLSLIGLIIYFTVRILDFTLKSWKLN